MLLRLLGHFLAIALLTVLTQVGGLIYLLVLVITRQAHLRKRYRFLSFLATYGVVSLLLLPMLAPLFGRVPLPASGSLQPLTFWTCVFNRHYVRPALLKDAIAVAEEMAVAYPGTTTHYLDANFPFYDGCPLPPHLSHSDGRKLDLAFYYKTPEGEAVDVAPSPIGYGVSIPVGRKEDNTGVLCSARGYWQYTLLSRIFRQLPTRTLVADEVKTAAMIQAWSRQQRVRKILLEPNLKQRWGFANNEKVRFHGCHAVQHDDHVHVQIR